jgi:hypothetical protein
MGYTIGVVMLVGFGCSGASNFGIAVCGSVEPGGQLDPQVAGTMVVAPDEKHVAFLRDPHTIEAGCISRGAQLELGTLVVLELQSDGSACQRVVADDVSSYSVFFSSDSQDLVFRDGVDHCGVGRLKAADSHGSNVRLVHGSVSSDVGIGSTVFFTVQDEDYDLGAPIAGGKTISLGTHSEFGDPRYASNATGTAFAYRKYGSDHGVADGSLVLIALPSGRSQTLVDGAAEELGNRIWSPRGNWLAFCHGPKGAAELASLTLVAADGSTRIDVSTNSACYAFTFSPDDAWLVYPEIDSSGGTRLLTYSLKDRSSVALGVLPEGDFSLAFSDESASVVATVDLTTSVTSPIYAGPAGTAGSLRVLVDTLAFPVGIVSAGGYVAVPNGNWTAVPTGYWTVGVYPVSGGAPVTIPGSDPLFEPGVPQPHLLLRQYPPSAIAIAATDGTAATTHAVPDFISFATWLGSAAVYGTAPDSSDLVTISALTSAGAVTTLLASEIGAYAWAPIPAPTRLFYSRTVATAGGPVGVSYADLPR